MHPQLQDLAEGQVYSEGKEWLNAAGLVLPSVLTPATSEQPRGKMPGPALDHHLLLQPTITVMALFTLFAAAH